jgi:hypothetical protein
MNDYELGAALRERVLQDRMRGLPHDGRRLQAVVGDLCGSDQDLLLPALRHLVMSAAFGSAAGQPRPLADSRLESRLMAELREVFAPRIVARMEAVVRGLLALEASGPPLEAPAAEMPKAEVSTPVAPAPVVSTPVVPAEVAPAVAIERRGSGALVALLAFLCGGLSLALVLLVTRQPGELPPAAGTASVPSRPRPQPDRPAPPEEPARTPPPPVQPEAAVAETSDEAPKADERQAIDNQRVDQAVRAVQQVYAALARRDYDSARALFAAAAADQFDPQFFSQFERVSVTDLQVSGAAGSSVNLRGLVTFVYPDGSVQTEARDFTVDTSGTPALITASEFGGVVSPRRR